MNSYPLAARKRLQHVLIDRGIDLHLNEAVVSINSIDQPQQLGYQGGSLKLTNSSATEPKIICCRSGLSIPCDLVIWVTQASAPAWIKESGLATDAQGFILISDTLQSLSHPHIFATGDIATMPQQLRPKAGVFAVRQGRPLATNLQRITSGQILRSFLPQQRYLSLISLGESHHRQAIAVWGNICPKPSRLWWWWKDRIDRQFMAQFQRLSDHV
jgi:selenide, water dikinase